VSTDARSPWSLHTLTIAATTASAAALASAIAVQAPQMDLVIAFWSGIGCLMFATAI
jgi:hypothetical protein